MWNKTVDNGSFEIEDVHDVREILGSDCVCHQQQMNWIDIFHLYLEHSINSCHDAVRVLLNMLKVIRKCVHENLKLKVVHSFDDEPSVV